MAEIHTSTSNSDIDESEQPLKYIQVLDNVGGQEFDTLLGKIASFGNDSGAIGHTVENFSDGDILYSITNTNPDGSNGLEFTTNYDGKLRVTYHYSVKTLVGVSETSLNVAIEHNGLIVNGSISTLNNPQLEYPDSVSCSVILLVSQNDIIRIRCNRINGDDTPTSVENGSNILLEVVL